VVCQQTSPKMPDIMDIEWQLTEVEDLWVTFLMYNCCQTLIEFKSQSDPPSPAWGRETFFSLLCEPTHYLRKHFLSLQPSRFTHFPPVVTLMESVTKTRFWKFCLAFTFWVDKFMAIVTSKLKNMWLLACNLCGCFVLTENLIKF
jgi:hypothetical protein